MILECVRVKPLLKQELCDGLKNTQSGCYVFNSTSGMRIAHKVRAEVLYLKPGSEREDVVSWYLKDTSVSIKTIYNFPYH